MHGKLYIELFSSAYDGMMYSFRKKISVWNKGAINELIGKKTR